jgi:hypothetical protein
MSGNELPEDTHLTYVVSHEAWYAKQVDRPQINVMASADGGGCAWEFTVEEVDLGSHGPAIRVKVFDDAFAAFTQIPEFFDDLAADEIGTLDSVRALLDGMGAVDETKRTPPRDTPGPKSLADVLAEVDRAQAIARSDHPAGSLGNFPLPAELRALRDLAEAVRAELACTARRS